MLYNIPVFLDLFLDSQPSPKRIPIKACPSLDSTLSLVLSRSDFDNIVFLTLPNGITIALLLNIIFSKNSKSEPAPPSIQAENTNNSRLGGNSWVANRIC